MNVWGWEDQPEIISMFKKAGLVEYETDYLGMIADLTAFHPGGPHKDTTIQFKKVTAPEQLITFGTILASLYEETAEEKQRKQCFTKNMALHISMPSFHPIILMSLPYPKIPRSRKRNMFKKS